MFKTKLSMRILIPVLVLCLVGGGVDVYLGVAAIPYKGTPAASTWVETDAFDEAKDYTATLDMGDKDSFVILNLADVQLSDWKILSHKRTFTMLDKLIKATNPDLITLTGDQVSGTYVRSTLKKICLFLDGYGIPWAPVLGNHDGQHNVTRNGNGDIFHSGDYKNVVFAKNNPSMGVGNYIINVTQNGKSVHTVFMLDSHDSRTYPNGESDYDYIWPTQIDWYQWAVEGIKAQNGGKTVPSSCFFHIPLVEYRDAYLGYQNGLYTGGNVNREMVCCAQSNSASPYNNGFFAKMKELGSTNLVMVGHDHVNCSWVNYNGITLAYGLKSGYSSYYDNDLIGGTTVTIATDGSTTLNYYRYQNKQIKLNNNISN